MAPDRSRRDATDGSAADVASRATPRARRHAARSHRARSPNNSGRSGNSRPALGGRDIDRRAARRGEVASWHFDQAGQQSTRFAVGQCDVGAGDGAADPQDHVEGLDRRSHRANAFPQPAAQSIAVHRVADRLASDDVTHAAGRVRRRRCDQLQEMRVEAPPRAEYDLERGCAAKPIACGSTPGRCRVRQTASRARPLARRAERTLRPPTVFIRARNPCVRKRRIFEGWNVRFIVGPLGKLQGAAWSLGRTPKSLSLERVTHVLSMRATVDEPGPRAAIAPGSQRE